jgi:hypothetical protein
VRRAVTPSPEPPSTRHGQQKKDDCPIIDSPNTIATSIMDKKKASTPEQRSLASRFLFKPNPSEYYYCNEDEDSQIVSNPCVRASLVPTAGPIVHSIGDVLLSAFIEDPKERVNIMRSIGSKQERAFQEGMANTRLKAFQGLVNLSVQRLVQLVTALHPAETEGLFLAAVWAAIEKAEMGLLASDPVPAIMSKAKAMLEAVPSHSIERH